MIPASLVPLLSVPLGALGLEGLGLVSVMPVFSTPVFPPPTFPAPWVLREILAGPKFLLVTVGVVMVRCLGIIIVPLTVTVLAIFMAPPTLGLTSGVLALEEPGLVPLVMGVISTLVFPPPM